MNPYTARTECGVCGGKGMARPRDAGAEWLGATLVHTDPRVCRSVLETKRLRLERLAEQIAPAIKAAMP